MKNSHDNTHEIIVVGIGGRGALATGQILAHAGVSIYKHVLWSGTYFAAGGDLLSLARECGGFHCA